MLFIAMCSSSAATCSGQSISYDKEEVVQLVGVRNRVDVTAGACTEMEPMIKAGW